MWPKCSISTREVSLRSFLRAIIGHSNFRFYNSTRNFEFRKLQILLNRASTSDHARPGAAKSHDMWDYSPMQCTVGRYYHRLRIHIDVQLGVFLVLRGWLGYVIRKLISDNYKCKIL